MTALRRRIHRRAEAALTRARDHAGADHVAETYGNALAGCAWAAFLLLLGGPPKETTG